ncbi:MAG: 23S rRNA pseudouridine(1911/1915/1917) synthase RluD [Gammaproteobacteria bacterium]|nr:23S rRNA pseudouridine(1911/1915/1917) synthase RluD [Gammaproteobacteria bacterium]
MITTSRHALEIPDFLDGHRLDAALAALCPDYSRTAIKAWIEDGRVEINGAVRTRARETVYARDRVEMQASLAASDTVLAEEISFDVIYEDAELLVIDKPAGLVVHPGAGNREHTLVNGLLYRLPQLAALPRAGLVHRLDKDTSGLLLVAKTSGALQRLIAAMARRQIHRSYEAIVYGVVQASGTIDAAVGRDRLQRTRMRVATNGRTAVTHYRVVKRFRNHTRLELSLETGRTHQIRVHMQHLGFPILGDPTYGMQHAPSKTAGQPLLNALSSLHRQALHAKHLAFDQPRSGEPIEVSSPLPRDMQRVLRALRDELRQPTALAP